MTAAPITCSELTKQFGSLIALESVTFSVNTPGVVGLVGPNGSGKSTLLRLLMGSLKPSSGDVDIFGRAPKTAHRRAAHVGYLGATDRMFPELTVLENMIYRGRLYGLSHQEASTMAARLLRERNLYALRDRKPDTLSTGQRRQVSLMSVLLHQPRILLLDEPTTGIDITAIGQIYQLMSELCDEDCTVLLATHSIEELVTLCSRTLALHDGQLVYDRPTVELGQSRAQVRDTLQCIFLGADALSLPTQRSPSPAPLAAVPAADITASVPDYDAKHDSDTIDFHYSEMDYGLNKNEAAS